MKHTNTVTVILVAIFVLSQLIGLAIIPRYIDIEKSAEAGKSVNVQGSYQQLGIEPPNIEEESYSFIYIAIALAIGTAIILFIVKFKTIMFWKIWFFISVVVCLVVALYYFVDDILKIISPQFAFYTYYITGFIAIVLAYFKIVKKNLWVHNLTEIFIYGGIAAILVNILNLISISVLLVLISIYDFYAVNKSKHMVKMAQFQTHAKVFAGLLVPYTSHPEKSQVSSGMDPKNKAKKGNLKKVSSQKPGKKISGKNIPVKDVNSEKKTAILGGGDITFPLLFAGVILKTTASYPHALIIVLFSTIALITLFINSDKGKFYPAMPILSAGCFAGYIFTLFM